MFKIMSEIDIKYGLSTVLTKIETASAKRKPELKYVEPILVAVSKTKPAELVAEAYECGQRHFGENYIQEIVEKSSNPLILEKCNEIKWHFIGRLQTNKINKILNVLNLYLIETVDSIKLATALNNAWNKRNTNDDKKLKILIQVNTSGEDVKNGIEPENVTSLTKHILDNCTNLKLDGLMTIGKYGYDTTLGSNPDFLTLYKCREKMCADLQLDWKQFHLSMGMSNDYEQAIELGSTMVRIGTSIFGARNPKHTSE